MKWHHHYFGAILFSLNFSLSANAISVSADLGPVTVGWTEGSAPTVAANSGADDWLKILLLVLANQPQSTESAPPVSITDLLKPKERTVADCANELATCSREAAWGQTDYVAGEVNVCQTDYDGCVASINPMAGL